jgi:hypothetical protein
MILQFVLFGQPGEVVVKHLQRGFGRFAVGPQAQQHAGDDRAVHLDAEPFGFVAEQVPAAQQMLEEAEEKFNREPVLILQRDDLGGDIEQVGRDAKQTVALVGADGQKRVAFFDNLPLIIRSVLCIVLIFTRQANEYP